MKCPNCGSENVTLSREESFNVGAKTSEKVKVVNKRKGHKNKGGGVTIKADKTVMKTVAVCQDCGNIWTVKNKKRRKGCMTAIVVCLALGVIGNLLGIGDDDSENVESTTEQKEAIVATIEDFDYEISGDEIILDEYNGDTEILTIETEYEVDGETYTTNLDDFQIDSDDVKTIIFAEGISEIKTSIFNGAEVTTIYFPTTMTCVYDYTLAYLHPDDGKTVQIYYGGTEDEWNEIFMEYERTSFGDAEGASEKGTALADAANEIVGVEYDASEFEYHFSASPEEVQ